MPVGETVVHQDEAAAVADSAVVNPICGRVRQTEMVQVSIGRTGSARLDELECNEESLSERK